MLHLKSVYRQFREEGYIIFPQVFKGEELKQLLNACDFVLGQFTEEQDRTKPNNNFTVMRHLNDTRWHSGIREHFNTIMETIADPRCLDPVEQIFAGSSSYNSTSYFVNPRFESTSGDWHRDSQFMSKDDQEEKERLKNAWKADFINTTNIQFQISLIDNDDIEYVPYSATRYDSPEEAYIRLADNRSHAREEGMPNAMRIPLKAGDAVIFNPFGLHRGRYHKEIPRRTLMLTYSPYDEVKRNYFTYQPWFEEQGYLDGLSPRTVMYFQQFADKYKDFWASRDTQLQEY